jgi:VCBS repeat-containing protein
VLDELFFSHNGSGSIYEIINYDTPSPTAVFKVTGTVTSNNDGASCPLASQSPFDPPEAKNDNFTGLFNKPLHVTISVLTNDMGNVLTVTSNTNPSHGTLIINSDGTFTYTPNANFSGVDTFTYTATDSVGRTASATVTITVTNNLPAAPATGFGVPDANQNRLLISTLGVLSASLIILGLTVKTGKHR